MRLGTRWVRAGFPCWQALRRYRAGTRPQHRSTGQPMILQPDLGTSPLNGASFLPDGRVSRPHVPHQLTCRCDCCAPAEPHHPKCWCDWCFSLKQGDVDADLLEWQATRLQIAQPQKTARTERKGADAGVGASAQSQPNTIGENERAVAIRRLWEAVEYKAGMGQLVWKRRPAHHFPNKAAAN